MDKITKEKLQKLLRKKKLPVTGTKAELIKRLMKRKQPKRPASVPAAKTQKIRANKTFEAQKRFYLSLLIQNPKSKMAQQWYKDAAITPSEFKAYRKS